MSIYVERRLDERSNGSMAAAVLFHVALIGLLATIKVAADQRQPSGGNPVITLTSFSNLDPKPAARAHGGGAGVETLIPMPSTNVAPASEDTMAPPAPPAPVPQADVAPVEVSGGYSVTRDAELMFPDMISAPPYPTLLEREGVETDLRLRLDIDARGRVTGAVPIGSHHRGFLPSTIAHIQERWRFRPKLVEGKAVSSRRVFTFLFRVEQCGEVFCQRAVSSFAD